MKLNNKKGQEKVVGFLRQAQIITTYGSGSIAELPDDSVVLAGLDYWKNKDNENYFIREENLENILGMDYFIKPKVEKKTLSNRFYKSRDIPSFRFPELFICGNSKCQKIYNYKDCGGFKINCPYCGSEKKKVSRFIVVCENGHMEDFPYSWWLHRGNLQSCENPEKIRFFYNKETGGLDNIVLMCESCKKTRTMSGSFTKDSLRGYKCKGHRPWLNDCEESDCIKIMQTLQRGSNAVYFGVHQSALSIPPWSSKINVELNKIWPTIKRFDLKNSDIIKILFDNPKSLETFNCSIKDLQEQILKKLDKSSSINNKQYHIIEDEYKAFINGNKNDENFKTVEENVNTFLSAFISRVILVYRLREVMVLKGFSRIRPVEDERASGFVKLGRSFTNWLPAIELNGEGIFIELDPLKIKEWEKQDLVKLRYNILASNMANSFYKIKKFSPRYILLHTLAHIFIRQLSITCGYSAASIKERIYSTFDTADAKEMSGFLIYTATPDSEGSLGGLVDKGKKEILENIFRSMIQESTWCASDPLCIQLKGQGMNNLNLAACHSCTLLPETSCETRNCFLDRGAIIGTLDNKEIGFFSSLL